MYPNAISLSIARIIVRKFLGTMWSLMVTLRQKGEQCQQRESIERYPYYREGDKAEYE